MVLVATAAVREHYLALDTGGRALIASLEGHTVPTTVYATGDDFLDGVPGPEILAVLRSAVHEAGRVAGANV